jgi:ATP-dependent Clp protease ATP-binding subunit ClpX
VLFICGGAFEGLDDIIARRVGGQRTLGFGSTHLGRSAQASARMLGQCVPDDLLRYGFIPEFVGRVPVVAALEPFDKEAMLRILTEPRNAVIKQFQKMFALDHVELEMTPDALEAIAERALRSRTGARALRTTIEEVLLGVMYDIPSQEHIGRCIINAEVVEGRGHPIMVPRTTDRSEYRRRMDEAV